MGLEAIPVHLVRLALTPLVAAMLAAPGCEQTPASTCGEVDFGAPYPAGLPYVGVHANAQNNDLSPCTVPEHWEQAWQALEGRAIGQPVTLSPDAATVYATTSAPGGDDDCTVFALDAEDGTQRWCLAAPGAINSSVEVDAAGDLYLAVDDGLLSLGADGTQRWAVSATTELGSGAVGLHFTPGGHVVTVTRDGLVALVARSDGALRATLDLPAVTGFVAPPAAEGGDNEDLLPPSVVEDLEALHGESDGGLGTFIGLSGYFSDNTVAVAPDGDLYVTGGGPDISGGTVIQVRVDEGADPPTLALGFHVLLGGFSAASAVISPDGRWLKTSDGVRDVSYPTSAENQLFDLQTCPSDGVCEPTHVQELGLGALAGSSPVLDGGECYHWLTRLNSIWDDDVPDVVAVDGEDVRWEAILPDDLAWSAPITLTDELVIGTATALTPSDYELYGFAWPGTAQSEVVALSRESGEVVFRAPVSDDAAASVTVAPDGSLYVPLLALFHSFASETRPVAGVVRFTPATP